MGSETVPLEIAGAGPGAPTVRVRTAGLDPSTPVGLDSATCLVGGYLDWRTTALPHSAYAG